MAFGRLLLGAVAVSRSSAFDFSSVFHFSSKVNDIDASLAASSRNKIAQGTARDCGDANAGLRAQNKQTSRIGGQALALTVWVPPSSKGSDKTYYTSSRYDWSSQIANICIGQSVVFSDRWWSGPQVPGSKPDGGIGLTSEFGCREKGHQCPKSRLNPGLDKMAQSSNGLIGWEDPRNKQFLKIGVGVLDKPEDGKPYDPESEYKVTPSIWVVRSSDTSVEMIQTVDLEGDDDNYGYELTTTVSVDSQAAIPLVKIETSLKNTCVNTTIRTPHYSHNLLGIENERIDSNWAIELENLDVQNIEHADNKGDIFDRNIVPKAREGIPPREFLKVERPLTTDIWSTFIGGNNSNASADWIATHRDNNLTIESLQQNAYEKIYKYMLFSDNNTLAPVPFQMIEVAPGETVSWNRTITFDYESYNAAGDGWLPESWQLGTAIGLMLATTVIGMQLKKSAMAGMDDLPVVESVEDLHARLSPMVSEGRKDLPVAEPKKSVVV